MSTYLDAAAALKEWVNDVSGLAGTGGPLPLGASLNRRDGGANVAYGYVVELPSSTWAGAENPSMLGRLSLQIYGPTREAASVGATAYCEALLSLQLGNRVTLPSGITIVGCDSIDGPSWLPDGDEPRYVVDAELLFA